MSTITHYKSGITKPYYEHAGITIYHGDCRKILPTLAPVDLVLTDPPYGLDYQSPMAIIKKDKIINDGFDAFLDLYAWFRAALEKIMTDDSEGYIFCGGGGEKPVLAYAWLELMKAKRFKVKNLLIWDKQMPGLSWDWRYQYETIFQIQAGKGLNNSMDGTTRINILRCQKIIPQENQHPTPKPVSLLKQILIPKPSKIVLDPFMGTGATLVAAKQLRRRAIGIELKEKYCEIAVKRLGQEVLPL